MSNQQWRPGDPQEALANDPFWTKMAKAGIDLDLVSTDPAGDWELISGDTRIAFGDATNETGDAAEGWDWTEYERIDGEWEFSRNDYAGTDEAMVGILADAAKNS